MKKNNNKGFTLMEMLIVVAIIAVLVAIAIPVFTNSLEKAREATDAANIRSAYAEVMACALTNATVDDAKKNGVEVTPADGEYTYSKFVKATQKQKKWQNTSIDEIAGIKVGDTATAENAPVVNAATLNGWTITYSEKTGKVTISEKQ